MLRGWRTNLRWINYASGIALKSSIVFRGTILLSLGDTISAIRHRMGKSMVEFSRLVGANQSSVSRYESGKTPPGKTMLILLLLLAQGDEKAPLLQALGLRDDAEIQQVFEGALASLVEYERLAARSRDRSKKDAGLAEFVTEAAAIAAARLSVDPVVADILRLLRTSKASPKIQAHLRTMMALLNVALAESKASVDSKSPQRRRSKSSAR